MGILSRMRVPGCWPAGYGSAIPQPIRDAWEVGVTLPPHVLIAAAEFGIEPTDPEIAIKLRRAGLARYVPRYNGDPPRPAPPSAAEITAMERVFDSVRQVPTQLHRRLLWLRAMGLSWRQCARMLHMHPSSVRRHHAAACAALTT